MTCQNSRSNIPRLRYLLIQVNNSQIERGAHFYKLEFKDRLKTRDKVVKVKFSNYEAHFLCCVNRLEQRAQLGGIIHLYRVTFHAYTIHNSD